MYESPEEKLREANERLARIPNNSDEIAATLLLFHSALENRLRELLVARLPEKRDDIFSKSQTGWPKLIEYSQEYLGLTNEQAEKIKNANTQRNYFAHGPRRLFTMSLYELRGYAQFVNRLFATLSGQQYRRAPKVGLVLLTSLAIWLTTDKNLRGLGKILGLYALYVIIIIILACCVGLYLLMSASGLPQLN